MLSPLAESARKRTFLFLSPFHQAKVRSTSQNIHPQEKGGEIPSAVDKTDCYQCFQPAVYFLGQIDVNLCPPDIEPSEYAGNRHECQEGRNYEKDKVVPGIYRCETEQQGNRDIKTAGPGKFQASGTVMVARIVFNSSSLSRPSCSGRQTSRWAPTGTATLFTSSGAT